jgi:hypothetical protein
MMGGKSDSQNKENNRACTYILKKQNIPAVTGQDMLS